MMTVVALEAEFVMQGFMLPKRYAINTRLLSVHRALSLLSEKHGDKFVAMLECLCLYVYCNNFSYPDCNAFHGLWCIKQHSNLLHMITS